MGEEVGICVGKEEGDPVGVPVGASVVGDKLGLPLTTVGTSVVGLPVDGLPVGAMVGRPVGHALGAPMGLPVVGEEVGLPLATVGDTFGVPVGSPGAVLIAGGTLGWLVGKPSGGKVSVEDRVGTDVPQGC